MWPPSLARLRMGAWISANSSYPCWATGQASSGRLRRWDPGSTARAMIVFKLDVGDQVVVQDYRQVRADRAEFSGHGVFMIDNDRGDFSSSAGRPSFGGSSTPMAIRRSRRTAAGTSDELIMQKIDAAGSSRASFRGRRRAAQLPDSRTTQ